MPSQVIARPKTSSWSDDSVRRQNHGTSKAHINDVSWSWSQERGKRWIWSSSSQLHVIILVRCFVSLRVDRKWEDEPDAIERYYHCSLLSFSVELS